MKMKKKTRWLLPLLLVLLCSCAEKPPEIKRMPYYEGCYEYCNQTFCEHYFLVKNHPEDLHELRDLLKKAADDFLTDETVSQCRKSLSERTPGKSEKIIEIRFFRVSEELPWDIDYIEGTRHYFHEITEGNPRDWIAKFRYDPESLALVDWRVWKRKKTFSCRADYGQILEEISNED